MKRLTAVRSPLKMYRSLNIYLPFLTMPKNLRIWVYLDFSCTPLKGSMKGFWSVTLRANWRVVFMIKNGDVYDVDLIDYH